MSGSGRSLRPAVPNPLTLGDLLGVSCEVCSILPAESKQVPGPDVSKAPSTWVKGVQVSRPKLCLLVSQFRARPSSSCLIENPSQFRPSSCTGRTSRTKQRPAERWRVWEPMWPVQPWATLPASLGLSFLICTIGLMNNDQHEGML